VHKKTWLWMMLSVAVVSFASCSSEPELKYQGTTFEPVDTAEILITESPSDDGNSRVVVQAGPEAEIGIYPEAIVSLSPSSTEILFAIGAGSSVIAVDDQSNYPPEAPLVEGLSGWNVNIEAVASFEPDLVIVSDSDIQEELEVLGIRVFVASAPDEFGDLFQQIFAIGEVTGNTDGAHDLVASIQREMFELTEDLKQLPMPLTYYHELDDTLYTATGTTFIGQIYALAGLENIADAFDEEGSSFGYPQLTQEFIFEADPDIIFFADAKCCGQSFETISDRPGWSDLKAVKNGNVIEINSDISSRWGPRLVDFLSVVTSAVSAVNSQ
jgi:iron complex transport system substrate-binding protein